MRMAALLVLLLALPAAEALQDKEKDKVQDQKFPKDPIKGWKYKRTDSRYDLKTKTMVEELTVILQGQEAIPVDSKKMIVDLVGVTANYFTTPQRDRMSKEMVLKSDRGRYDHEARILTLKDNVRLVKKNDDEKPPLVDTVLTASSAVLRFDRMYECPICQEPLKTPGRCLKHNEPLKELTITNLDVDSEFELTGPEGIVSGEGLETDDEIQKKYHIRKNGFVEFGGDTSSLLQKGKPSSTPEAVFTQIFSRGPLRITGPDEYRRQIVGEGGVRVDRIDSNGSLTIHSQDLSIETLRVHDPKTMRLSSPEIRKVDASGKVLLDGVMFEDGTTFQTTSDTLERRIVGNLEMITLGSSDVPVHVKSGSNTIEARKVFLRRIEGAPSGDSVFENVLRSDLVAGNQHFSLKADHLKTFAEPNDAGRADLRRLVARGHVVLGGLMSGRPGSKEDPGEAHADLFEWDVKTEKGKLEAQPLVRITQGTSIIVAPLVILESPKLFVLKGPKQVTLIKDAEGEKEEYRASCSGDMVLDNDANRLLLRNECVIRTKELLLHSDRVHALLAKEGSGLESLTALGNVRALRRSDQTTVYGERLAYRFKDQDLKVYGAPYVWADTGRSIARQEQIRIYEKENPKTKQKIRYTQMDGGRDGLRIEIEERTRPGEPVKTSGKP
jgi:lipopolysaccharide export system protein LptA